METLSNIYQVNHLYKTCLYQYESIILFSSTCMDSAFSFTGEAAGSTLKWASRLKISVEAAQG